MFIDLRTAFLLVLLALSQPVLAESTSVVETVKDVEARYAADRKLCAEEASADLRMQCLRDAKSVYTDDLAAARKSRSTAATACADCGKVLAVQVVEKKGDGGALGLIGGGVAGALLGNQVGGGRGKTLATIAGAAGGAYAGKMVEEQVRTSTVWSVRVRFEGGEEQAYEFDHDPHFVAGDRVRRSGDSIAAR